MSELNSLFQRLRIVLVEPSHPGNIGGSARAMKTMGLERLVLVNPARFPDPQADWRAAGAMDVLDSAQVVADVSAAVAGCHYVVGTSTRARAIPWPAVLARDLVARAVLPPGGRRGLRGGRAQEAKDDELANIPGDEKKERRGGVGVDRQAAGPPHAALSVVSFPSSSSLH